jgi:hypothetical protein
MQVIQFPLPPVPNSFPELTELTVSQLERLLEDDAAIHVSASAQLIHHIITLPHNCGFTESHRNTGLCGKFEVNAGPDTTVQHKRCHGQLVKGKKYSTGVPLVTIRMLVSRRTR